MATKGDGVALRSMAHPVGPRLRGRRNLNGVVDAEITLSRYASAGDQVTCENNHLICEFLVDVCVGQTQDLDKQLGKWTQSRPVVGDNVIPVCATCGAAFYDGGRFHFRDGWRKS